MSYKNYKRHTVTAALPYANGPLHIGHIAGAYLPADIYVRFLKLQNRDVVFVCGSDEHGAAITLRAKKEGISPQEIIDKYNKQIGDTFKKFGIEFDIYHRTSAPIHHKTAQDFFLKLNENGEFLLNETEQYFDTEQNQFLADRYITGTCPKCSNENAYGDQCEKCGSTLSPQELINPKSTLSGSTPIKKSTKHWFLDLSKHEPWLKEWISNGTLEGKVHHNPKEWKNHVLGQCMSWIDGGLLPRAMTRDLDWGVKVPLEDAEGKVLYVWLDAPIGYISATKEWAIQNHKNWEDYWKKEDTQLIHFIGKDNIVFHCIIFPAILKSHGEFILPENVPANEFLNLEGDKLSTSRNWAVWLHEYIEDFPGKEDVLRYTLTSIAPENKDSEFTWKDFQAKNNNELVAILGNFINRSVVLLHKYYGGKVPAINDLEPIDREVCEELAQYPEKIASLLEQYKFKEAQFEMMNVARLGNKYFAETEPWKLIKENPERVKTILNIGINIVANLAVLANPFLPNTTLKIAKMIGLDSTNWELAGKLGIVKPEHQIGEAELIFDKVEDKTIEEQLQKLENTKLANKKAEPLKENIPFEQFTGMDLRVATILHAEKIPKTNKLLKIELETSLDKRTVVSGIAEFYKPEEIIGKQIMLLANLEPRKIKGIESKGMILLAEDVTGKLVFMSPESLISNGAAIK